MLYYFVLLLLLSSSVIASATDKTGKADPAPRTFSHALAIWIGVFVASLAAGGALGKIRSIDFKGSKGEAHVQKYVSSKVTESIVWESEHNDSGELTELTGVWSCRFVCGIRAYVYDSKTHKHHVEPPGAKEVDYSHPPRNGLNLGEVMSGLAVTAGVVKAIGSPAVVGEVTKASALPNYATLIHDATGSDKVKLIIFGLGALLTGFIIGYLLVYREQPEMGSGVPKDLLKEDVFWQGVAQLRKACTHSWKFETRNRTVLVRRDQESIFVNVRRSVPAPAPAANPKTSLSWLNPELMTPAIVARAVAGTPAAGTLFSSLMGQTPGLAYELIAPPDELITALTSAGEAQLAQRLSQQAGLHLGPWTKGFPS